MIWLQLFIAVFCGFWLGLFTGVLIAAAASRDKVGRQLNKRGWY